MFSNLAEYHNLEYEFSEKLELLYSLDFEESGLVIRDILNKRYPDNITGLENVEVDNETITGIFLDQISPTITKKFNFTIDSNTGRVTYEQVDTGNLDYSEVSFAAKRSQTCTNGKSFGCTREDGSVYCLPLGRKCATSKGLDAKETKAVKAVVAKAPKATKATTTKTPKVAKEKVAKEPKAKKVEAEQNTKQGQTVIQPRVEPKKENPRVDIPPSSMSELVDIPDKGELTSRKGVTKAGSGAFGTVYVDRSTNPPRAIKYGDIMSTEYTIGKKLGELGVSPRIYSDLETRGKNSRGREMQAMSMEFIEGKTVNNLYPKEIPDDVFQSILNTRKKINLAGIAHNDYHDENIIIDTNGKVFALDPYNPTSGDWTKVMEDIVSPTFEKTVLKRASKDVKARYKKASQKIKEMVSSPNFWREKSNDQHKQMVEDFYKEFQK